ncbi:MAG TPA: glycosyltransferase family 39 protein, partial [Chloroflexota bacterium]
MLGTRAPARARTPRQRSRRQAPPPLPATRPTRRADAAMLLVLLAAFATRMWHLGWKSLWLDEGISVTFAADGPPRLFEVLIERDIHPPLYYLTLWGWTRVGGSGETSLRFPSVLVGVLLVALLYRLAGQLRPGPAGRATGLLAASLATFSPFLIYTSQEARMYGALAAAGLGATIALRWALEARRPGALTRWGLYALAMAVPPYLHHFGWMIFAFHGAFLALASWRYRARALPWLGAAALAALAYLPWLGPLARQVARLRDTPDFWQGALSLWFVAQHVFAAFAVGALLIAWHGLLRGRTDDLLLILYLVLPTAILYAIVARNPKFADRYLIVALPAFLLLLARGVVGIGEVGLRLRGRLRPAGLAAAGLAGVLALGLVAVSYREGMRVYDDEAYAKEDYRGAVDFLIRHWQSGDAVLLMLDSYQVFDYYSHGKLTRIGLNPTDDLEFAARELNRVVEKGHPRLWVLMWNPDWADPSGAVRAMLDETLERLPLELDSFR